MTNEVKMILTALEENDYAYTYYGLRTDDNEYSIGDTLPDSLDLHECEMEYDDYGHPIQDTEERYLDGTSATNIGQLYLNVDPTEQVEKAVEWQQTYRGKHQYLIAGDEMEYGEDEYEIIIKDAVVIAIIR